MTEIRENMTATTEATEVKTETTERATPPRKAFDMEYATQWRREMEYLKEHGINYTFRRKDPKWGIATYKYTKTEKLFTLLAEFYAKVAWEKQVDAAVKMVEAAQKEENPFA